MATFPETHDCEWRGEAERLKGELGSAQERLGTLEQQLQVLQRHVFGKKSEKLPRVEDELKKGKPAKSRDETLKLREERRAAKGELPEREVHHRVPPEKRNCPSCGSSDLRVLGEGKRTVMYEYVPARFERQVHLQETLSCRCGGAVVVADGPIRPVEKGHYGPGFMAHLVTSKCCDSIPLYRQAKAYARAGVPIARTTMGDLFHAAATALEPLYKLLLKLIALEEVVLADETPIRVLAEGKTRKSYVWTFRTSRADRDTSKLIAFRYSATRSGSTATDVLGGTRGYLVVDGYTGYNAVTLPDGRIRVGCWAHVRRKLFDALSKAPEAQEGLDLILDLYRVEHAAQEAGILGTEEHLNQRRILSADVLERIRDWVSVQTPNHLPKSPMGEALRYASGQWAALSRFLEDARLPLDNNASEGALRPVALGRKNYLFVGHDEAGENTAGLYSLVATCEANGINPEEYLKDVLVRVATHPNSALVDLLPHRWRQPATVNTS